MANVVPILGYLSTPLGVSMTTTAAMMAVPIVVGNLNSLMSVSPLGEPTSLEPLKNGRRSGIGIPRTNVSGISVFQRTALENQHCEHTATVNYNPNFSTTFEDISLFLTFDLSNSQRNC